MIITFREMIALSPILIIGLTIVCVMLCISFFRDHFVISSLTVIGIKLALLSLYIVNKNGTQIVTDLIIVDNFSVFFSILILFASLVSSILSYTWLNIYSGNREEFYLLILISAMGSILLVCTHHLVMIFLGMELLAVPLYGLIGYSYKIVTSLEASIKYTILSTVASSFLLFGIALIYACFGQLSVIDFGSNLNNIMSQELFLIGLGFILTSFGFKLSLVPFHSWTADVYQGSSIPVNLFLATVSKIAIFAMMVRILPLLSFLYYKKICFILMFFACCSMLFANIVAVRQNNIKRILGYSSIAHFSYILVGLFSVENDKILSLETIGVALVSYLLSSLGIFSIMNLISSCSQNKESSELFIYRGLFWEHPFLSLVFTVIILSLAGIPITLGFISKFYVIVLSIKNELWWFVGSILLASIIGIIYYLRMIITIYSFTSLKKIFCNIPSSWCFTPLGLIILVSSFLILFLGIYPHPLVNFIKLLLCN